MIIGCTKKLLDKLKIKEPLVLKEIECEDELKYWHCNILKYGRENAILLTHNKTLFSFFLIGLKAEDFIDFKFLLSEFIFKTLINLDFKQHQIELVLDVLKEIDYAKSSDKSVLASMNQIKKDIDYGIMDGEDIFTINYSINRRIYSRINYDRPIDRFRDFLDLRV